MTIERLVWPARPPNVAWCRRRGVRSASLRRAPTQVCADKASLLRFRGTGIGARPRWLWPALSEASPRGQPASAVHEQRGYNNIFN